jgi:AmmeMemoRadiSam system protein A
MERCVRSVCLLALALAWQAVWSHAAALDAPAGAAVEGRKHEEAGVTQKQELSEEQGRFLLCLARDTIDRALSDRKGADKPDPDLPEIYRTPRGTFVTLTIHGGLRGCIGHIVPQESLIEGIRVNAVNAAFRDPRFRPLSKSEWKDVRIEISILTEPRRLEYDDAEDLLRKLRPGVDGVILKKGYRQATFLPQVWEQLPQTKEFLSHLCQKAGLAGDAWRSGDLEVSTYQVQAFHE